MGWSGVIALIHSKLRWKISISCVFVCHSKVSVGSHRNGRGPYSTSDPAAFALRPPAFFLGAAAFFFGGASSSSSSSADSAFLAVFLVAWCDWQGKRNERRQRFVIVNMISHVDRYCIQTHPAFLWLFYFLLFFFLGVRFCLLLLGSLVKEHYSLVTGHKASSSIKLTALFRLGFSSSSSASSFSSSDSTFFFFGAWW